MSAAAGGGGTRILLTGATGVVGTELSRAFLRASGPAELVRVARRPQREGDVSWEIGGEAPPEELRRRWDVVVHAAASTRWTMTRQEAVESNVRPLEAVLDLVGPGTHLVHVSTAYVGGSDPPPSSEPGEFGRYRNGYEWSKAECEDLVAERHDGPTTIVRPPLILGRDDDGSIARFSGPYTLLQTLVSGLAAAVIGEPGGYAEVAPVDQVAEVILNAATGPPPDGTRIETIAGGSNCMTLETLLDITCRTLNGWREERGIPPVAVPPFISARRWHRFFLPFAEQHLSPIQLQAVRLLGMFEGYTSMADPFEPTHQVADPAATLVRSVLWWADAKPRLASRISEPWGLIA
ncbi:SDR family oxidoreductase [Streptosporangium carneum]|uniref:Dehydrogenase n=1 Tax=Streptosporangium carneum TaxID=47481 RepID=A0A9W6I940_9ACTN|nr:SDR family oxidoreductase [Streptosporangium carneum]GLK13893.1 dehydrogenase [Streptosporangium carneum]